MAGVTVIVENLHRGHGANILHIFSFRGSTGSHNIQLVPKIQNTSFHHPVRISIDSLLLLPLQLVPNISKVKVKSKYVDQDNCFFGNGGGGADTVINCGVTHSAMEQLLCKF